MTKALLIEPEWWYIRMSRCMQKTWSRWWVYRFPLDSVKIASYLKENMVDVKILDLQAQNKISLQDALLNFKPDIAIISTWFPSMRYDARTAELIKKYSPETFVSMFGIPPTLMWKDFLDEQQRWFPIHADHAMIADPVQWYVDMINNWFVPGITHSAPHKDRWLILDRSLVNNTLYKSPVTWWLMTYIEASVWCPKRCNFCVIPYYFNWKYVHRKTEDIIEEIKQSVEKYWVEHISIWDEWTTFSRKKIKELCEMIIELKASAPHWSPLKNFIWNTRTTTDLIDEEIVDLLDRSWLVSITMGIESLNENVLSWTWKWTTIAHNFHAIELLSKSNIISIGHFVFWLPWDTKESAIETFKNATHSKLDMAQFYCAIPYPGTELHKLAKEQWRIEVDDLTQYELSNPIMWNENMTAKEVWQLRSQASSYFYMRKWIPLAKKMLRHSSISNIIARWYNFAEWLVK